MEQKDSYEFLKVISQWSDSILTLINNLIEDVIKVQTLGKDISIVETKVEFLTSQLVDIKNQLNKFSAKYDECSHIFVNSKEFVIKYENLDNIIKELKTNFNLHCDEDKAFKKDYYIQQGKIVAGMTIVMVLIIEAVSYFIKRFLT
jgi:archaellum component FlaC